MATVKGPMTICTNRKSSTRQVHKYLNKLLKSNTIWWWWGGGEDVLVVDGPAHLLGNVFLHELAQYRHITGTWVAHRSMNDLWHFSSILFPIFLHPDFICPIIVFSTVLIAEKRSEVHPSQYNPYNYSTFEHLNLFIQKHLSQSVVVCGSLLQSVISVVLHASLMPLFSWMPT